MLSVESHKSMVPELVEGEENKYRPARLSKRREAQRLEKRGEEWRFSSPSAGSGTVRFIK